MGIKINQYALERLTFGDDDYYDIDYFDGANYQTAKILGSTIKAGINAGIIQVNLYSDNGQLATDREVGGNSRTLSLGTDADSLRTFEVVTSGLGEVNASFRLRNNTSAGQNTFEIRASNNTNIWFAIENEKIKIKDSYYLPIADGTNGQVLATDGLGNTAWITVGGSSANIYTQDGTISNPRVVTLDDTLNFVRSGATGYPTGVANWIYCDLDIFTIRPQNDFVVQDPSTGMDWLRVGNGEVQVKDYILPLVGATEPDQIIKTTGTGLDTEFANTQDLASVNMGSTQWSATIPTPQTLPDNSVANGFTFFDNVSDKVAGGTTTYDEYNISYGIDLTLTGTGGAANIFVDGTPYLATFNTDLQTTVTDWIATHEATLSALGVNVLHNLGSPLNPNGAETIRFCASESSCNSVSITNTLGSLNGTRINLFTGVNLAAGDHVLVPYDGTAYEGQRIQHKFRVNFGIVTGSINSYALSLRRFANDTIIGSEIVIQRNPDVSGVQESFISYTAGASDPFVLGGFYFALRNDSGQSLEFTDNIGILCQHTYQKLTKF